MYLVFKENILIATLLKRGNKNVDIKFSAHEHFWNNLHQVAQNRKIGKPNNSIVFRAQDIWVLMLCRSFFTPGRYIGSVVFMVWDLVQSGMLSCDSTVNTDWHCWGCWIFAVCQLWSVHRSSLVWHLFCLYRKILYITGSWVKIDCWCFGQGNLKVGSVYFFLYSGKTCKLIVVLSSHVA